MSVPPRRAAPHWLFGVLLAGAMAGAMVFALLPAIPGREDWFPQADKLRHAATFLFLWMLGRRAGLKPWTLAGLLLLFGVGIEVAQSFTPDHEASVFDVLADLAGIGLGAWLVRLPPA